MKHWILASCSKPNNTEAEPSLLFQMQEPAPGGIWNRSFLFLYLSACINGGKCKCAFCTGYQTSSNFSFLRSLAPFKVEFSLFVRCFLFFFFLVRQWTLTSLLRRFSRVRTQLRTLCSLMLSTWGWVSYFVHSAHTFNFSDHNVCVWWNRRRVCVWRTAIGFCVCACVCPRLSNAVSAHKQLNRRLFPATHK